MPGTVTVRMSFTKATKNTYRYDVPEERTSVGDLLEEPIRTVYVQQAALGPNPPQHVIVQVTPDSS